MTVTNTTRGRALGARIRVADRFWTRLRGLLGAAPLADGEGLLLAPCRSVHMLGMRFPLDVAFLGPDGAVVATYHGLRPGARSGWHRDARTALELPAGTLRRTDTREGDVLVWQDTGAVP